MKKSKLLNAQIATALKQIDSGAPIFEVTRALGIREGENNWSRHNSLIEGRFHSAGHEGRHGFGTCGETRGYPHMITVDNGTAFTPRH